MLSSSKTGNVNGLRSDWGIKGCVSTCNGVNAGIGAASWGTYTITSSMTMLFTGTPFETPNGARLYYGGFNSTKRY